jgi:hypothetical protein
MGWPEAASHIRTVLSEDAEASIRPSGEKATLKAAPLLLQRASSATCSALSGEMKAAGCGTGVSVTDAGMQAVKINKSANKARFIPLIPSDNVSKDVPSTSRWRRLH